MPDAPDNYRFMPDSDRAVLQDMAELAARLGSPNLWQRSGATIWQDNMSRGVAPYIITTSTDEAGAMVVAGGGCEYGYNLRLIPDLNGTNRVFLRLHLPPAEYNKWGVEIGVKVLGDIPMFDVALNAIELTKQYVPWFRVNLESPYNIEINTQNAGQIVIGQYRLNTTDWSDRTRIKMLFCMDTLYYDSLRIDDRVFTLTEYSVPVDETPSLFSAVRLDLDGYGEGDEDAGIFVNHIIVTLGEP